MAPLSLQNRSFECPRCFYVDNKLGTKRPGFPTFNLNLAVDELFKKEFDVYRKTGTAPASTANNLQAVPFAHEKMDTWREVFEGIDFAHTDGLSCFWCRYDGRMDPQGELIIADYKATSKEGSITALSDSSWDQQYTRQLGVYRWLLEQNGFKVREDAYLVCQRQ